MTLMSLLLAAVTFNPVLAPHSITGSTQGDIQAQAISPDATCKAGAICASRTITGKWNYCFFTNVYNGVIGGTPLTVNVTQTGAQGSPVYIYWVNTLNKNLTILGGTVKVHYTCV
jgi:hypothetical protein